MIDKLMPQDCALCGSCVDACPVSAISLRKPYLDFHYPQIDPEACISCGLCEKVCPVLNVSGEAPQVQPHVYAARNADLTVRRNSSSGGVFWALAQTILSRGGYVCGAVIDDEFRVHHSISNQEAEVRRMMGSKYAQSDLTGIYRKTKSLLQDGALVLFTGCACQIASLRSFLGKEYENLILAEIICHGIPSNTMLRIHLDQLEKKYRSKIDTLCFRDKKFGWHRSSVRIRFQNGAVYCVPITDDTYMKGYFGGIILKESCYHCKFKNFRSGSDLTMGDFWGAEAVRKDIDDNTGLSAVLCNSPRGEALLKSCGLELWEEQLDTVIRFNRNLIGSTKRNSNRDAFYAYAEKNGYSAAMKAKLEERLLPKLRRKGKYALRCVVYALLGRGKPLY